MKLGKIQGYTFNDIIDLELTPSEIDNVINAMQHFAMSTRSYTDQGDWRDLKDKFQNRYDEWRKQRDEKDKD